MLLCMCVTPGTRGEETVRVECGTSVGDIVIEVHPAWSPLGAARYLELVKSGFFTEVALFRVVPRFLVQFGVAADPQVSKEWTAKGTIKDDPNIGIPVKRGTMAFAGGGKDSRTTQIWIAFSDSEHLGKALWETPFAQVVEGMDVVDKFYSGYGDMKAFGGSCPDSGRMMQEGNAYVKPNFPDISYVTSCKVAQQAPSSKLASQQDNVEARSQAEMTSWALPLVAHDVVHKDPVGGEHVPIVDADDLGLDGHEVEHVLQPSSPQGIGPVGMAICFFIAVVAILKAAHMLLIADRQSSGRARQRPRHLL
eukprot:jgi/Tetstr1/421480/TSEL_012428.t2